MLPCQLQKQNILPLVLHHKKQNGWDDYWLTISLRVSSNKPVTIMEDNQGAIAMSKNPIAHSWTKPIDICYHYIHEATQEGLIKVHYCPRNKILADILTKPLPKAWFRTYAYTPSLNMVSTSRRSPRLAMKRTCLEEEMKSPTIKEVRACFGEAEK